MNLLEISLQYRVIIGISAMVVLFTSFLIAFITSQRKKLQYHKDMRALQEQQHEILTQQNVVLEKRVQERTAELLLQKEELQATIIVLKSTQSQLVQREKMASLGELTAGIAHEIQNPLNFVNNFSEVNTELIEEMKKELFSDNKKQAISIADDIKENHQRISHHGKRADSIVKSMLQHTRINTGHKEMTDINELASEYFRLSYQGLRAKDKSFNASVQTDLDQGIGKLLIIPQDIGRVILNLTNNAFYSVMEKAMLKKEGRLPDGQEYEPNVSLKTRMFDDHIEIRIRDNGKGISEEILDKIFQPFYTTKPPGQGTGLGLSLSYDIIKGHGGELKVETKYGEYAEFIIELPLLNPDTII